MRNALIFLAIASIATGCGPKPVIHPAVLKLEFDAAIPHVRDDVTGVTHLTLRGRQIGTDAHRLIERCTNLRVLSIRACSADQSPMLAIAPAVQQLYVSNLKSRGPVTLTGGESLGMLVFTSCELDNYDLDRLRSNDTLTQLTVVDCTVSDGTISWIHHQNTLTTLQYGNNDASSDLFVNWASTSLTHVDIAGMIPSPDAVAFLERQPSLSHFSIDLCGDPIAGTAVAMLQRKSLRSAHFFCVRKDLPRYNRLSSNAIPIVRVYQRHNDLSRTKYTDDP